MQGELVLGGHDCRSRDQSITITHDHVLGYLLLLHSAPRTFLTPSQKSVISIPSAVKCKSRLLQVLVL